MRTRGRALLLGWLAATILPSLNRERAAFNRRRAASPVKPAVGCRFGKRRRGRVFLRHLQHRPQALCWNQFRSSRFGDSAKGCSGDDMMMSDQKVVGPVLSLLPCSHLESISSTLENPQRPRGPGTSCRRLKFGRHPELAGRRCLRDRGPPDWSSSRVLSGRGLAHRAA